MDAPIRIAADREALLEETVRGLLEEAGRCLTARGAFRLAISHGPLLEDVVARLARPDAVSRAGFPRWTIFWVDERLDGGVSHYETARRLWLRWVPVPPSSIHGIHARLGPPRELARRYAGALAEACGPRRPRFDVALLELAEDGTLGGWGDDEDMPRDERWVVAGRGRVALAPALLERSRRVLALASGVATRPALARRLAARGTRRIVPFSGPVEWWVDRGAFGEHPVASSTDGSSS